MYALPAQPTARDIIVRSLVCHPSLYAEALAEARRTHAQARDIASMHQVRETAARLAAAAQVMAHDAARCADTAEAEALAQAWVTHRGPDYWATALNLAARLQCLPPHVKAEAAQRLT